MHALPIRMASASIQLIVALLHAQHCRIFFLKPNCSLKKKYTSFIFKCCSTSLREGNGNPLQYSCLENPMDRGAWWAAVHEVAESRTRLSDFNFTFHFRALEKEMETRSSALAWRIPGTGEPGGLPSMGSHIVRHDWSDLVAAAATYFWLGVVYELKDLNVLYHILPTHLNE